MAWYLLAENGKPNGISNSPTGECYEIDSDKLVLDAYSIVDGQAVYDAVLVDSARVREKRDLLLARSDWTQLEDVPTDTRVAWQSYRQALRDITNQVNFPYDTDWPDEPE